MPKGVMVNHGSVVNTLDFEIGLQRKRGIGKTDPCIQVMSVFADMSGALIAEVIMFCAWTRSLCKSIATSAMIDC